jgi:hypothetical protein
MEKAVSKGMEVTYREKGVVVRQFKMDRTDTSEEEVIIQTVADGGATAYSTRLIQDESLTMAHLPGLEPQKIEEIDELAGHIILSKWGENGWTHELAEGQPTETQREALAKRPDWESDEETPEGLQKVGASWEIDAVSFKRHLGRRCRAASGKLTRTFRGLVDYNGHRCAVIRTTGTIRGKVTGMGNKKDAEHLLTMTIDDTDYQSLRHGVVLKTESVVTMKDVTDQEFSGQAVEATIEGTTKSETITTVIE